MNNKPLVNFLKLMHKSSKFNKVIDILFMKKKNLTGNTEYLIKLRNLLLPKLMSGEIRVNDIEANL